MRKISVRLDHDVKDRDGLWVQSWSVPGAESTTSYRTRAASVYWGVLDRCRPGGWAQKSNPKYQGCENGFDGFQSFATWCHEQPGYMERDELGRWWVLDKDILCPWNKAYSPQTCCFVPQRINNLLIASGKSRGEWPLGVCRDGGRFKARIRDGSRRMRNLGLFADPLKAHQAWQAAKIASLLEAASSLAAEHAKASAGLVSHARLIEADLEALRETVR